MSLTDINLNYKVNILQKHYTKIVPRQAGVAQGVLGRLRPRINLTFGTTRAVGRQPYALATFTQEKSLVLIFRG